VSFNLISFGFWKVVTVVVVLHANKAENIVTNFFIKFYDIQTDVYNSNESNMYVVDVYYRHFYVN